MIRGFYTAVSGMLTAVRRMDTVVNNLANAQTTGYKQERSAATSFSDQLLVQLGGDPNGAQVGPIMLTNAAQPPDLDLSQGALRATGRALDVGLDGPGFLAVQTAQGDAYTRDGSLTRDGEGYLTTATGVRVLGRNGPIQLPPGELGVRPDGTIMVDDVDVDQLRLVEFGADQSFERQGQNLLAPAGGGAATPATSTTVQQGFVEASNVDVTGALTTMLELQRAYDANQRMIQQHDQMLAHAVNDVARPGS
jgi:flagellar basal-body rod protein FlgG